MEARYIITLTDPDKRELWEQLLENLAFVKVEGPTKKKPLKLTKKEKEFMEGLRESIQEMKDDISGKKKLKSARAFLDELRAQPSYGTQLSN